MGINNPNRNEKSLAEIREIFPETLQLKKEKRESLTHDLNDLKQEEPVKGPPPRMSNEGLSEAAP